MKTRIRTNVAVFNTENADCHFCENGCHSRSIPEQTCQRSLVCSLHTSKESPKTMIPTRKPGIQDARRTLSIGEAAAVLELAVNTLRFYEAEGLIIPERTKGNQRRYSSADLDRIRCIREAVGRGAMTIDSIRHIMALIPCWDIIGCSSEDRMNCSAYATARKPCWTLHHKTTICTHRACRECEVYKLASSCDSIKSAIVRSTQRR